jgi:hypothetical protein
LSFGLLRLAVTIRKSADGEKLWDMKAKRRGCHFILLRGALTPPDLAL